MLDTYDPYAYLLKGNRLLNATFCDIMLKVVTILLHSSLDRIHAAKLPLFIKLYRIVFFFLKGQRIAPYFSP